MRPAATVAPSPPVHVGDAQISGPLTVFPIIARAAPALEYRSFAQAVAEGFVVRELPQGASVNDLQVMNPLGVAVLLYEGEQVSGAQQDRTLDVTVLVPAGARTTVPVSCVEAGRWDGSRKDEAFSPGTQAAYPALRAMKHRHATAAAAFGGEARADQGAVWSEVAAMSDRSGARSASQAMNDVFEHRREAIDGVCDGAPRQDGQVGAVAVIAGAIRVVDFVSRTDVWAALHGPLVQGYALDALDHDALAPTDRTVDLAAARLAVEAVLRAPRVPAGTTVGLGRRGAVRTAALEGAALEHDGELIQLSAFPTGPGRTSPVTRARIRRPSSRG